MAGSSTVCRKRKAPSLLRRCRLGYSESSGSAAAFVRTVQFLTPEKRETSMESKIQKRLRLLEIYAGVLTLLVGALLVTGFIYQGKQKFKEIDVGRINIVESDGRLRMTISNKELAPDPTFHGKAYPLRSGGNSAGMIFFNNEGTECGGLIFDGSEKNGKYAAGSSLTLDQFNQDQTVGLQYEDENGERVAGLKIWDRGEKPLEAMLDKFMAIKNMKDGPEKTKAENEIRDEQRKNGAGAMRVFVGKEDPKKTAEIILADPQGKPRMKLSVDGQGNPHLDFLDADGKVTYSLPEAKK